jgi:hypothetical protein
MNTYTVVFKKRLGKHIWVIKETATNLRVAGSTQSFDTMTECVMDLREFLNWMAGQSAGT